MHPQWTRSTVGLPKYEDISDPHGALSTQKQIPAFTVSEGDLILSLWLCACHSRTASRDSIRCCPKAPTASCEGKRHCCRTCRGSTIANNPGLLQPRTRKRNRRISVPGRSPSHLEFISRGGGRRPRLFGTKLLLPATGGGAAKTLRDFRMQDRQVGRAGRAGQPHHAEGAGGRAKGRAGGRSLESPEGRESQRNPKQGPRAARRGNERGHHSWPARAFKAGPPTNLYRKP
jgi:hypothetical protein